MLYHKRPITDIPGTTEAEVVDGEIVPAVEGESFSFPLSLRPNPNIPPVKLIFRGGRFVAEAPDDEPAWTEFRLRRMSPFASGGEYASGGESN